jgi:hypothetical protein
MSSGAEQHREVFDRLRLAAQRELLDTRRNGRVSAELKVEVERAGGSVSTWTFLESEPGSEVYVLHADFVAFLDKVARARNS